MITPFTQAEPRLAFNFAPSIKHESLAKMSQAQKEQALHEFIDMRDTLKAHIFNPVASPQSRIFALGTFFDRATMTAYHRLDDVTGQAPVWIGDKDKEGSLSHRLGISRNAISNELTALEKAHLAKRFYRKSGDGNEHLDVSISEQLLTHPELLPVKGERPRRPPRKCKECGDTALIARVSCLNCGCVNHEHLINDEETEQDPEGFPDTASVGEVLSIQEIPSGDEREPEQAQQPLCTRDVQYVSNLSNTITDCTRDVHNAAATDSVVLIEEQDTATTPAVLGEPSRSVCTPEQTEQEAAELLLAIAGPLGEKIRMNRQDRGKFTTVHKPVHLGDMLSHLRGCQTFGATLAHPDGMTRAFCADADHEEDMQKLWTAARLLATMDFKPLIEVSPIPEGTKHAGGGKLWVIFDGLVDAYSAQQTIYQYAPMLKEIAEYWPRGEGNRVRLPGGRYVRPRFDESGDCIGYVVNDWCTLYDAHGNERARDGERSARVLLEHLSSTELVNEYDRPVEPEAPPPCPPVTVEVTTRPGDGSPDLAKHVIDEFNRMTSWDDLARQAGGYDARGFFPAKWRGNQEPYDVHVDPDTDLAKDFGQSAWLKAMDKYEVWCLLQGGLNWREFKRRDLDERCKKLRGAAEVQPVAPDGTLFPMETVPSQPEEKPCFLHPLDLHPFLKKWMDTPKGRGQLITVTPEYVEFDVFNSPPIQLSGEDILKIKLPKGVAA